MTTQTQRRRAVLERIGKSVRPDSLTAAIALWDGHFHMQSHPSALDFVHAIRQSLIDPGEEVSLVLELNNLLEGQLPEEASAEPNREADSLAELAAAQESPVNSGLMNLSRNDQLLDLPLGEINPDRDSTEMAMGRPSQTGASVPASSKPRPSVDPPPAQTLQKKQASSMSEQQHARLKSMYAIFNAMVHEIGHSIDQFDPRYMKSVCIWMQTKHPLAGLNLKQRRTEQAWADSYGKQPIKGYLTRKHLKRLIHLMYVWSCQAIGPVETDQMFAEVVRTVARKPESRYFHPRDLL